MHAITRIFFLILALLAIGIALWLSITLIGVVILLGGAMVLFYVVRQFLIDKKILNSRSGVPEEEAESKITVIDTTFTRVDE